MNMFRELKLLGCTTSYIQRINNETADLNQESHFVFLNATATTSALTLVPQGANEVRKVEVYALNASSVASAVNYNSTALYTFAAANTSTGTVAVFLWDGTTWRKIKYEN